MPSLSRPQRAIVLAHVLLALVFGAVIPPYEAHDETGHFAVIQHLRTHGVLPDARRPDKAFFDQAHQPPLYYLTVAALTYWTQPEAPSPARNPFSFDGSNRRGVRILLRQPGEDFPWAGHVLALHAARMVSALLGGAMITLIAAAAGLIFRARPGAAVLTTAIAAFNPQTLFMAAMVNNDILIGLMGAALVYALLRLLDTQHQRLRDLALPGAMLGLSLVSKNSALALIGFVGLALLVLARHSGWSWAALIKRGLWLYLTAVIVAAPLYVSNLLRYGQLLVDRERDNKLLTQPGLLAEGLGVGLRDDWLLRIFSNAFRTFWGTFGWGNVPQPDWVYSVVAGLCAVALIGALLRLHNTSHRERTGLGIAAALGVTMLLLPTYRAIAFQDPALLPGRYLMPALFGYTALLGFGAAGPWNRPALALLLVWPVAVVFGLLRPAYQPALRSVSDAKPLLRYADVAELLAVNGQSVMIEDREGPRLYARVRLTWRALRPTERAYALGIGVIGRNNDVLGSLNSYPQRGNYPSTVWQPGAVFTDEYDILLEKPCTKLPALGRINIAMFEVAVNPETGVVTPGAGLPVRDTAGVEIAPLAGRFKIEQPTGRYPIWWQEPRARFDNALGLRDTRVPGETQAGQPLVVHAQYELLNETSRDVTVFVHAYDRDGQPIAQDDHAPSGGALPTSLMSPGECADEVFTLNIPTDARGPLTLVTGWYDVNGRMTATTALDPQQPRFKDDLVPLGTVVLR
jgi:Predicted membrane protein (DUF2142)